MAVRLSLIFFFMISCSFSFVFQTRFYDCGFHGVTLAITFFQFECFSKSSCHPSRPPVVPYILTEPRGHDSFLFLCSTTFSLYQLSRDIFCSCFPACSITNPPSFSPPFLTKCAAVTSLSFTSISPLPSAAHSFSQKLFSNPLAL